MPEKIDILHIITSLDYGGAERHLLDLVTYLDKDKFSNQVIYLKGNGLLEEDFLQHGVSVQKMVFRSTLDPFLLWKMYRYIAQNKCHIVHTHLFRADFYGGIAARLAGASIVISSKHNISRYFRNPFFGLIGCLVAKLDDAIIAISRAVEDFLKKRLWIDDKKIHLIYYGLAPVSVKANSPGLKEELGIKDFILVGCVGNFKKDKGHIYLLRAAYKVLKRFPHTKFVFVGEGALEGVLRKNIRILRLEDDIIFTGSKNDVWQIMNNFNILVLPSLREGLGRVILEGMSMGLPIIATTAGAIPEIVIDGETGILVSPKDDTALASAIIKLISDEKLAKGLADAGKERLERYFLIDEMVKQTERLYEIILEEKQGSGKK